MQHKLIKSSQTMNLVNYMASPLLFGDTTFLGFLKIHESLSPFGIDIDNQCFCAVHILNEKRIRIFSDDKREQTLIDQGYNFVLILYGSDNTSYVKRFKTKEDAIKWFQKSEELHYSDDLFWYNS